MRNLVLTKPPLKVKDLLWLCVSYCGIADAYPPTISAILKIPYAELANRKKENLGTCTKTSAVNDGLIVI